jgi:hypothetical protein
MVAGAGSCGCVPPPVTRESGVIVDATPNFVIEHFQMIQFQQKCHGHYVLFERVTKKLF